jgi:PAS domain-containing protein
VLFALLTYTTAKRINGSIKELVVLKETFADQLNERTAELQRVNMQLREEIQERKQAEQALANSERRLTDIIEFLPDPTWVIDIDGKVIAWNRAVERITGIDKENMIGRGGYAYSVPFYGEPRPMLVDLALRRDAHWEKDYLSLKEEDGMLVASESFHPSMAGEARYFASTASRLYDAQENVVGSIESIRDITAAKRLEKEREKLIGELRGAIAKIRTLSGLLPICSSCKKIRDDKGYWNQIETFIRDHSEAEFSHGICPDCARILYPDLDLSSE